MDALSEKMGDLVNKLREYDPSTFQNISVTNVVYNFNQVSDKVRSTKMIILLCDSSAMPHGSSMSH